MSNCKPTHATIDGVRYRLMEDVPEPCGVFEVERKYTAGNVFEVAGGLYMLSVYEPGKMRLFGLGGGGCWDWRMHIEGGESCTMKAVRDYVEADRFECEFYAETPREAFVKLNKEGSL
jgi:hypothetical protein